MSSRRPPWVNIDLRWSPEVRDIVIAHAVAAYPYECCGYLTGPLLPAHQLTKAARATNQATARGSSPRDTFAMDELRLARALEEGVRSHQPVKVIYHSHCDANADLSMRDRHSFLVGEQLSWPCAFLILDIRDKKLHGYRLWSHVVGTQSFQTRSLTQHDAEDH